MFSYDQLIVIAFYDSLKLGYYPLTLFYSVPDYIFDVKKLMLLVSFNCTACIQGKISNAINQNKSSVLFMGHKQAMQDRHCLLAVYSSGGSRGGSLLFANNSTCLFWLREMILFNLNLGLVGIACMRSDFLSLVAAYSKKEI